MSNNKYYVIYGDIKTLTVKYRCMSPDKTVSNGPLRQLMLRTHQLICAHTNRLVGVKAQGRSETIPKSNALSRCWPN